MTAFDSALFALPLPHPFGEDTGSQMALVFSLPPPSDEISKFLIVLFQCFLQRYRYLALLQLLVDVPNLVFQSSDACGDSLDAFLFLFALEVPFSLLEA